MRGNDVQRMADLKLYTIRRTIRAVLDDGRVLTLTEDTDENGVQHGKRWRFSPVYAWTDDGQAVRLDALPQVPGEAAAIDGAGNLVFVDDDGRSWAFDGRYVRKINVPAFSVEDAERFEAEQEAAYLEQKTEQANAQVLEAERRAEQAKADAARARKLANEAAANAAELGALTSRLIKDGLPPSEARAEAEATILEINKRQKEAASKFVIQRKLSV